MVKRHLLAAFLVSLIGAAPVAADTISFDPDGGGALDFRSIDSLDWGAGNAIAIGADANSPEGTTFQLYYQANLDTAKLSGGAIQYTNDTGAAGTNDSITLVVGFQETISDTNFDPNTNTGSFTFDFTEGGVNFFQIYANTEPGDNLEGACFVCGTLIMSGTVVEDNFVSVFNALGDASDPLDGAGDNDYPGVLSLFGAGSVRLEADVAFADPNYFLAIPSTFTIDFAIANTNTNMPFSEIDPSTCFFADTAPGAPDSTIPVTCTGTGGQTNVTPFAGVASVGAVNAITGPNTMFQADATSSFEAVPEPASLTLLGLGLMGSAAVARRRQRGAKK